MTTSDRPAFTYLATVFSVLSLFSVFWLVIPSFMVFNRPSWNGSPSTYESYRYAKESQAQLDQTLAPLGITGSTFFTCLLIASVFVSFSLITISFCFWPRHILIGKVLTVASAVLFLPFLCCGGMLGVM